jgi:hypothetical protein
MSRFGETSCPASPSEVAPRAGGGFRYKGVDGLAVVKRVPGQRCPGTCRLAAGGRGLRQGASAPRMTSARFSPLPFAVAACAAAFPSLPE